MQHHGGADSLWNDPISYIIPQGDAYYQRALLQRSVEPEKYSAMNGLFASFGLCVLFLMLRFLFNGCFQAVARAYRRSKDGQLIADKLEEEIWVTGGGMLLLIVGWQCLYSVSDYCSIADSSGCLRGWPVISVEANVLKYYNVELGWYMHLMLKHPLGLGLQDNGAMYAHHFATVALVVMSYLLNVHLLGLLVFCVLNVSSPLLHISKLANTLEMQRAKTAIFAFFALVFLLTRVLLFPYVIAKAAMYDPLVNIPGLWQHFAPFYSACNVLLLVLCVMQCVWFSAVVRILRAALAGSNKQLQAEMSRDPAGQGSKILVTANGITPACAASMDAVTDSALAK